MKNNNIYKLRKLCPHCLSLSIKKSYKRFKCGSCNTEFETPIELYLMHRISNNRCIDNNVESRIDRLKDNIIIYNED